RALISNSLADSELDTLHLRKGIALYEASARDWEATLRIDPSNQIAWNNLANARFSAAWGLQRSGRISESQQEWRTALEVEKQELRKNRGLAGMYGVLADASYNLKDYVAADREIKLAIDHRRQFPKRTLQDERDASDELILAAMIAARLGHSAEAQQIIEPVL